MALCGAVVKTVFQVWTGGNVLAGNVGSDLTDLISTRINDSLTQRKVENRFASIAEIVGDRVTATLRDEFRNVAKSEQEAAILAVTQTLEQADLTDVTKAGRVIFAAGLDAARLLKSIRLFAPDVTRDLSWDATELYNVVLSQCCASIVEIADKLPSFHADGFTALLSNERQILDRLKEVLERLPMPSQEAAGSDHVEVDYRRLIVKDFDKLQLFGLDFAPQMYPLSIAYVSLAMTSWRGVADGASGLATVSRADRVTDGRDRSLEEWLKVCPRLLIQGRAGGGRPRSCSGLLCALRCVTSPVRRRRSVITSHFS